MKVTNKYSIYLDRRQSDIFIDVMQGDAYSRELEFSLYSGNIPWVIPPSVSVAVAYSGPGIKGFYDTLPDGTAACCVDENCVKAVLVPETMSVAGRTKVSLLLSDVEGKQLSTFSVILRVVANPNAEPVAVEQYVNILNWSQAAFETLAIQLRDELDQRVADIENYFCYVAEDDGEGNITLKPFHLGGVTDTTLSKAGAPADAAKVGQELANQALQLEGKAPSGYGLGGSFSQVYAWEDIDSLKTPGWYLVDPGEGFDFPNSETIRGIQMVRVDGDAVVGEYVTQTLMPDGTHGTMQRSFSANAGAWYSWYSVNPGLVPWRRYRTAERYADIGDVGCILLNLDTVPAGESIRQRFLYDTTEDFVIINISGTAQVALDGSSASFCSSIAGLEVWVSKEANSETDDGGYSYFLEVRNNTGKDLKLQYLIKYTDACAWE